LLGQEIQALLQTRPNAEEIEGLAERLLNLGVSIT